MTDEIYDDPPDPIDALARELPAPTVPPGFADAVLAAHAARTSSRRTQRRGASALAATALFGAIALVVALVVTTRDLTGEYAARAETPVTVPLGDDATAVLDQGAALSYLVDARLGLDRIEVEQTDGRAFYRVAPGADLTVHTPAGDVVVRGTCFFVDVHHRKDTAMTAPSLKSLAGATAGAVLGATLSVLVLEGNVDVKNAHGSVSAAPGATVTARADEAPRRTQDALASGEERVTIARAELDALRAAASNSPEHTQLVKRAAELEARLQKATAELALVDEVNRAEEGEPLPFPTDLPARFSGVELQRAFEAAMEEVGIKGGVIEVDCAEYPCIVYGQLTQREDMEKLRESTSFAPYAQDSNSTSVWGTKTKRDGLSVKETYFGVLLAPEGEKPDDAVEKRQERRMRDGWERIKPAGE